jgi:hypothetical protein
MDVRETQRGGCVLFTPHTAESLQAPVTHNTAIQGRYNTSSVYSSPRVRLAENMAEVSKPRREQQCEGSAVDIRGTLGEEVGAIEADGTRVWEGCAGADHTVPRRCACGGA